MDIWTEFLPVSLISMDLHGDRKAVGSERVSGLQYPLSTVDLQGERQAVSLVTSDILRDRQVIGCVKVSGHRTGLGGEAD